MSTITKGLVPGALACMLAFGLSACGSDSPDDASSGSSKTAKSGANGISCEKAGDLEATPKQKLPSDVPIADDAHVYMSKGPFGKTSLFFAWADADPANLDGPRDEAAATLQKAGYTIERKDQEEGSEAEAHLSGPHDVAIQVIQLCQGKVRIKYTIS